MRAGEQPIVERLLPDDDVVLISPDYDVVVPDHVLSAAEVIADATARADLVAVVAVDDVKAILVDNGAWIRTRLSGLITRVLSASLHGQALSKRKRVDVYITGGELRIGQVLVKAGNPLKLPAARQYLLFMKDDGAAPGPGPTHTPLLIEQGKLQDTLPPGVSDHADPLNGMALSALVSEVRRGADRRSHQAPAIPAPSSR